MPFVETALIIKGATAIAHWIAVHGTGAMATKAGVLLAKYAGTHGIANTVTVLATTATTASFSVGCILWTTERLKLAGEGLQAIQDGDPAKMVTKFAHLALKLDIDFDMLPDAIEDLLTDQADFSKEDAHQVAELIHAYEKEIEKEMNRQRR
jgi:glyoxylate carboligase